MEIKTEEICVEVLELPQKIQNDEELITILATEKQELQEATQRTALAIEKAVLEEVGADGKSKYPNQQTRQNELKTRLDASKDIREAQDKIREIDLKLRRATIQITFARERMSAIKAVLNFLGRKVE